MMALRDILEGQKLDAAARSMQRLFRRSLRGHARTGIDTSLSSARCYVRWKARGAVTGAQSA